MNKKMILRLLNSFDEQIRLTKDTNHAAACAIFDSVFCGNLEKWNAPQDKKWISKYNRALLVLADNDRILLCAKGQ